ncbi:MAG: hypothetical protein E3J94_03645 [Desulfobacteraceae bacterium]|nr:MAG: hypothetical protein E3J94_03645 [Desulfobacteraceae bacterium]
MTKIRLTIICSKGYENIEMAELAYFRVKNLLEPFEGLQITGNIVKILDPCCGKANVTIRKLKKT